MEEIEIAVGMGQDSIPLEAYTENVYCGVKASFITYYDETLWIGTHHAKGGGNGTLSGYKIHHTEEGTQLQLERRMDIPTYAQGVSFIEEEETCYMLLSVSWGRFRDSKMYLYEMKQQGEKTVLTRKAQYTLPPMSQELISEGGCTYILFESAATCYSTENYRKCAYPVDRICALSNKKMVP